MLEATGTGIESRSTARTSSTRSASVDAATRRTHAPISFARGERYRVFDRERHLFGAGKAAVGIALEATQRDRRELERYLGRPPLRRIDRTVEDARHRLRARIAEEQPPSGEELPEDDRGGEDIGAPIDGAVLELLRRHVRGLALQLAALRRRGP